MPYKLCHAQNIKYKPILFWCSFILKFDFKMHLINEFSVIFNEVAYFLLAHSVLYMMNMHKNPATNAYDTTTNAAATVNVRDM